MLIHIFSALLSLSLVLGAGSVGFKRTAHALVQAGLTEIVICSTESESGDKTVRIDRHGHEVDPSSAADCGHCGDCSLLQNIASFAPLAGTAQAPHRTPDFTALSPMLPRAARVPHLSRGPPMTSKV